MAVNCPLSVALRSHDLNFNLKLKKSTRTTGALTPPKLLQLLPAPVTANSSGKWHSLAGWHWHWHYPSLSQPDCALPVADTGII